MVYIYVGCISLDEYYRTTMQSTYCSQRHGDARPNRNLRAHSRSVTSEWCYPAPTSLIGSWWHRHCLNKALFTKFLCPMAVCAHPWEVLSICSLCQSRENILFCIELTEWSLFLNSKNVCVTGVNSLFVAISSSLTCPLRGLCVSTVRERERGVREKRGERGKEGEG